MEKQKITTVRWDNDLYRKVEQLAKKENRTFAAMVKNIIIRFFGKNA